jgi:hypothetical protein
MFRADMIGLADPEVRPSVGGAGRLVQLDVEASGSRGGRRRSRRSLVSGPFDVARRG